MAKKTIFDFTNKYSETKVTLFSKKLIILATLPLRTSIYKTHHKQIESAFRLLLPKRIFE